jgi:hypothetical protein
METNRVATQVRNAHNVIWHIKMAAAALEHAAKYHTNVLSKDRTPSPQVPRAQAR